MIGLYNKPGRGCKPTFNLAQKKKSENGPNKNQQLKQVLQKVKKEWGIKVSTKTIQRILKMLSMSWHRMRRGVRESKPWYEHKKAQLEEFKRLEDEGKLYLYFR